MAKKKRARATKKRVKKTARRRTVRKKKAAGGRRKKTIRRKKAANGRRKKKRASRATQAARRKKKTTRRRRSGLATVSTAKLRTELTRRERQAKQLQGRRDRLLGQLAALDKEIATADGKRAVVRTRRGRRAGAGRRQRNKMNLVDALRKVLANKTMSISDAAEAVQRAGYKTSSANFRTIVNQSLLANRKVFRKVARGQYTAR